MATAAASANQEFRVEGAFQANRGGPVRWVASHCLRNRGFVAVFMVCALATNIFTSAIPTLTGRAFDAVVNGDDQQRLAVIALAVLGAVLLRGVTDLGAAMSMEVIGKRLARDARQELYASLLGKSQTFHNRQRTGDIMARATGDMTQLSSMIVPGLNLVVDSCLSVIIPLIFISFIDPRLLLAPAIFIAFFAVALRRYMHQLEPVAGGLRGAYGAMNAGLAESISGIEVVKSTAQEGYEEQRLAQTAARYRDLFAKQGDVQARYLPPLVLALALVIALLHGVYLVDRGSLSIGQLVAYMGLMGLLGFVTHISLFSFALVQMGLAGARRILATMNEETELDENPSGYDGAMRGEIVFDHVSFSYDGKPVLHDISFRAMPGQTVAIVGQTGSGKSTLTKLVNRIYDPDAGRVTIDGVDTRNWNLDRLRSQIATIEQDVFLFSRSIAENIAFSLGGRDDPEAVEAAARGAQAHEFIMSFKDGYETEIGERGVTLSGGQRQRIAIARALLTDPRILILDDSTSAVDSATEDEIQRAIQQLQQGRTTLLITHRLSQIRWADHILVLRQGELVDQGSHAELLQRCELYRRIFSHYGERDEGWGMRDERDLVASDD